MPSRRLLDLQALRGLACLLVLLYHAAEWERLPGLAVEHRLLAPFRYCGYAGVDLFFVLSGFIITWVHADHLGRPAALPAYALRRCRRLYPVYWVCWLGVNLPRWRRHGAAPSEALTQLLLLPRPGPERFPQGSLQAGNVCFPQSWTLVYELLFYLLFAAFILLPRRCFLPLLTGWFLAVAALALLGLPAALPLQPLVLEFLLGCFAAALLRRQVRLPVGPCLGLGVLWFAAGSWLHFAGLTAGPLDPRQRVLAFGVPSALLVAALAARERAGTPLLPRPLRSLGDASYSIYLSHVLVFWSVCKRSRGLVHHFWPHLAWIGLLTGTALAAGYLLHVCLERPLLRGRRSGART
jgi:peptidoglycan/LPS O-acetylase OafA/YrhL